MHAASVSPVEALLHCVVCGADTPSGQVRTASIRSNVRAFADETFGLWQCGRCGSIHAAEEVDLDHYYAKYPFHGMKLDLPAKIALTGKVRLLEQLGIERSQRIIDYGCGGGAFVQLLQLRGYQHASGYDPYVTEGPYAMPPSGDYDVVMSQDVLEHVANPIEHIETLAGLTKPGGLIVMGTPNAAVIDLAQPLDFIHMLHQPYHRHILTPDAIAQLATSLGLSLVEVKLGFYGSRAYPGLNARFLRRILRSQGDVLDDLLGGVLPTSLSLYSPAALWDALTGNWRDPGHDMTVALRKP